MVKGSGRIPDCHPQRRHAAFGMCDSCYEKYRTKQPARKAAMNSRSKEYQRRIYNTPERQAYMQEYRKRWWAKNRKPSPYGTCPICQRTDVKLYKDHCHETGNDRELICNRCNLLLGHAQDNTQILREAILYLEKHR